VHIFIYDHTFEGFLTAVFDAYDLKIWPGYIIAEGGRQTDLFAKVYHVITNEDKAARVWTGLHKKISEAACNLLSIVFLSEQQDIEMLLFRFIQKAFDSRVSPENNFGDPDVIELTQWFRKVTREAERMRQFVRFQKMADGVFFAAIDPKYNVLPLTVRHFQNRFADQRWIVYDNVRKFGFYYDLSSVSEVRFGESAIHPVTGKLDETVLDGEEKLFQELWKTYFSNVTIKERLNPSLHKKLLPKRFWKYLPEKY
jgi:probable DNA metabolism protein